MQPGVDGHHGIGQPQRADLRLHKERPSHFGRAGVPFRHRLVEGVTVEGQNQRDAMAVGDGAQGGDGVDLLGVQNVPRLAGGLSPLQFPFRHGREEASANHRRVHHPPALAHVVEHSGGPPDSHLARPVRQGPAEVENARLVAALLQAAREHLEMREHPPDLAGSADGRKQDPHAPSSSEGWSAGGSATGGAGGAPADPSTARPSAAGAAADARSLNMPSTKCEMASTRSSQVLRAANATRAARLAAESSARACTTNAGYSAGVFANRTSLPMPASSGSAAETTGRPAARYS